MKLLIFSDSHGQMEPMTRAVLAQSPDIVIHLGDYVRDAEELRARFPQMALVSVRGNCDFACGTPEHAEFFAGPVRVFACHGHRYGVKTGLDALLNAGHFSGAGLVLYGHTHIARHLSVSGMEVLNPGPAGKSCAVAEISDAGAIVCRLLDLTAPSAPDR